MNAIAPTSTTITTVSGQQAQLTPQTLPLYETAVAKHKDQIDGIETKISDTGLKASQLKRLQDYIDTAMASAEKLANGGMFQDISTSIYKQIDPVVSNRNGLDPSKYLGVQYAPGAPKTPLNVTVHSIATESTIVAGRPASLQSTVAFSNTTTDTLSDVGITAGTLTLRKSDYSGFESITLNSTDTLQQAIDAINATTTTTGIVATAEEVSGSYYLKLTANARETYISFGDGNLTTFNWDRNVSDATTTYADLDTTTLGSKGLAAGGTLTITGTGTSSITLDSADTLGQVVTKINAVQSTTGVSATTLYDEANGTYRLTLGSTAKGTSITLDADTAAEQNALTALGLSSTEGEYTGRATVNGMDITTTDNQINLKQGRVLTLKGADSTQQFSVSVLENNDAIETAIIDMVIALNQAITEVQWHRGVRTDLNEKEDPKLNRTPELDMIEQMLRDLTNFVVSHSTATFRQASDIGITVLNDPSHNAIDTLQLDLNVLRTKLAADRDDVTAFFKNAQAFTPGFDEDNYSLVNGPSKGISAAHNKEVTVTVRYQGGTYYADFEMENANTSTVEFDPAQQYISADPNSLYSGMVIKRNTSDWSPVTSGNETVKMTFTKGWMGNVYDALLKLESTDELGHKGALHLIQKQYGKNITDAEAKKAEAKKRFEHQENRILAKIAKLIAAQNYLKAMQDRWKMMVAMMMQG